MTKKIKVYFEKKNERLFPKLLQKSFRKKKESQILTRSLLESNKKKLNLLF